jgi:dolichol-phosphate mannosyltransferase
MRAVGYLLALIQIVLLVRFARTVWASIGGEPIPKTAPSPIEDRVSIVLPVLNEESRIEPCLVSLLGQGQEVAEILVVDGGSRDGTRQIVRRFTERDDRVRLVDASPVPGNWNGKAWGLQAGLDHVSDKSAWVCTIDADVRTQPSAIARTVHYASTNSIPVLSVATSQRSSSSILSVIHPSLLSTLVYRFGVPGKVARTVDEVQANGQFALYRRDVLQRTAGFAVARDSICEDVTVARHLFLSGYNVGFVEGDRIADVEMYSSTRECLENWPRSLSLRDRFVPNAWVDGLVNTLFLQVIPLILVFWRPSFITQIAPVRKINMVLLGTRVGILLGMRRAYSRVTWTYWLSPLADPITLIAYSWHLLKRRPEWRGRKLVIDEERT